MHFTRKILFQFFYILHSMCCLTYLCNSWIKIVSSALVFPAQIIWSWENPTRTVCVYTDISSETREETFWRSILYKRNIRRQSFRSAGWKTNINRSGRTACYQFPSGIYRQETRLNEGRGGLSEAQSKQAPF